MDFITDHLLTLILFTPVLAALIILLLPGDQDEAHSLDSFCRQPGPVGSLRWYAWFSFKPNLPGFQFQEQHQWYAAIHSSFHLGVDGLSLDHGAVDHLADTAGASGFLQHHRPGQSLHDPVPAS